MHIIPYTCFLHNDQMLDTGKKLIVKLCDHDNTIYWLILDPMNSILDVFNYELSIIIYEHLDTIELIDLTKALNRVPKSYSQIKREIEIDSYDHGIQMINIFKSMRLRLGSPKIPFADIQKCIDQFPHNIIELNLSIHYYRSACWIISKKMINLTNLINLNLDRNTSVSGDCLRYFPKLKKNISC
jgi:hypothetical protein